MSGTTLTVLAVLVVIVLGLILAERWEFTSVFPRRGRRGRDAGPKER
ncbi:MAG: hypothetical protein JWP04_772 [Belnapia sp.]|nr:hypothetical protein [Belnapia sp.]